MSDLYLKFVNTPVGKSAAQTLGLPSPVPLSRWKRPDQPFIEGHVLVGASAGGKAIASLGTILGASPAELFHASAPASLEDSAKAGSKSTALVPSDTNQRFAALVFDASGMKDTAELRALYDFFHPTIRKLSGNARVLIIGQDPANCKSAAQAASQRALEGFTRAVGKEIGKKGSTANLLWLAPGAEKQMESSVRFFLSPRSAYVSGQVARISKSSQSEVATNPVAPLTGKVALVTGASRGIGESIAETLARDGATVIGLDIPQAMEDLQKVTDRIKGKALACDITSAEAPKQIAAFAKEHFGGIDLVIHNAGITRDKTLGNMPEHFWDMAIAVNLTAEELIDEELLSQDLLRENGRIVCVSSISGIAGNFGQTNYACAKSGVIGYVEAMAKQLKNGITINAVAPGFIETQMTAAMPLTIREAGRRMNSLSQGGLPVDVAEAIGWYCNPTSVGVNGNVVRVCGQSLIGK
ncbi:3-oxoacyl-ACP reductase [Marinobacter zhejiangensis]|uniref:3-oxoacyl-[acyl-carrier protein] reductase n=1 Tax=Marinobacter zhejiangensis TaxID=488535 RepID=A0A1I4QSJ8_9GAMM|nr:3-oxoacyl-ACP reductase [Marinobacter zhejiangensis]SFM43011.1 3-oxoacyl-[acyl-carrier protein] reductase [Marinobacter zhejiangensis]